MRLSLSVRVAESFSSKEKADLSLDQLIDLALKYGYQALCMRASQIGIQTPPSIAREGQRRVEQVGLEVSMVTGDFSVPRNDGHGPDGLRNITPFLDLSALLGSDLIRVCMKKEEDIPWAQRASDEAADREICLAHQSHCASLFETLEGSLTVLEKVNRPNFGIIYEPANWMVAGEDYGREAIRRLEPYLFNVYVQNHRLDPEGTVLMRTWKRGKVPVEHIGLWEEGGVDFEEVFLGLDEITYTGFVTVHQAFAGVMQVEEAVSKSTEFLKRLG